MPIFIDIGDFATPTTELGENRRVKLTLATNNFNIQATDGTTLTTQYDLIFYTHANPAYASVEYVQLEGGEVIERMPEASIYLMIYAASSLVDDIVLFDIDRKFPDKTTSSWKYFQRARTEFVVCKALADLYRAIIGSKGTGSGRKTLADFTIDLGSNANLLAQARNYLRDAMECYRSWREVIYAGGATDHSFLKPQSAVKSGTNPYEQSGIGRGWVQNGPTLNNRESSHIDSVRGNKTKPRRYNSHRRPVNPLRSGW